MLLSVSNGQLMHGGTLFSLYLVQNIAECSELNILQLAVITAILIIRSTSTIRARVSFLGREADLREN